MASSKRFQDWMYLLLVTLHTQAMLGVDFVQFYPQSLISLNSPLHFLSRYHDWYITTLSDPYYDIEYPGHFFKYSIYMEMVVQLPLALYLLSSLLSTRPLPGPAELAGTVYGFVVGLFTLLVCFDTWYLQGLDEKVRSVLFWQVYLPFGIAACVMGLDMYARVYARLTIVEGISKSK